MDVSPLICLDGVSHHFVSGSEKIEILNDCSLHIAPKAHTAIVGASGSGKSTLLGLMAGLSIPVQGTIHLLGHNTQQNSAETMREIRRHAIGFIFQDFKLVDCLSALDNVRLPGQIANKVGYTDKALAALDKVGLSHRLHHYPHQLSGGEQQRVAIARSIAQEPKLLFADEPTGNLDSKQSQIILDYLFSELPETTIVLVSHDPTSAIRCETCYHLRDGHCLDA